MSQVAETERLNVRKFNENDAKFIFSLLNSPGWLEFIGDRNIKSTEDARLYIVNSPMFSYHKFGFGPYLVELKDSKIPIGMCSLIKRETLENVDLGFAFLQEHLGKGFAYEASKAVLLHAKKDLGLNKIVAITNTTNSSSINLLKKLGFTFENTIKMPGEEEELFLFSHSSTL